jgi:hypothetical protein
VSLRPQLRRDRHPTIFRPRGTPLFEATVLPHLLFGCGDDIFGGNLGVTSLRDTISSRRCTSATPPFGLRPRPSGTFGLWARPIPPHHLGSSIGQAFQSHLLGSGLDPSRPTSLETPQSPQPPPAAPGPNHLLRRRSLSRCQPTTYSPGCTPPPSVDVNHG